MTSLPSMKGTSMSLGLILLIIPILMALAGV